MTQRGDTAFYLVYRFGFCGHLPLFIQQFLSDRLIRVRVGGIPSKDFPLEDGVPQGSIFSVTFFCCGYLWCHWCAL